MSQVCQVTGKRPMTGNNVSHANNRTKRVQQPNLQSKRLWLESQKRFVKVRVAASTLRTITNKGLDVFLREQGLTVSDIS